MLPSVHRLRRSLDFAAAVRSGRRAGQPTLVVHLSRSGLSSDPPQVGFVVGRAVGPAVVRNRVRRRLRHLMRDRVAALPPATRLVVRALPPAGAADFAALGRDLDAALRRLTCNGSA